MIEIKEGWTGKDAANQHITQMLDREINSLNEKLTIALEKRAKLQEACDHNHVLFAGQEMTCDVCGARIDK